MAWAGAQLDPWIPDDVELGDTIRLIGQTYIRPDFDLTPVGKTYAEISRVS